MKIILLISALILSTCQVWAVTRCTTNNLCQNGVFNDNRIKCIDDNSCTGSTLTATDTITCKGRGSCERSDGIVAENNIICSGYESCYRPKGNITSISGDISCVNTWACALGVNPPTVKSVISGRNIKCFGNRACMHAIVEATANVRIAGYMSCPKGCRVTAQGDITVQDDAADIEGALTATNINVIGGYARLGKLTVSNKAFCKSDYSCVGAVYIRTSSNTLEVEFKGIGSGYGANVYCPDSGDCTIKCSNGGVGCSANRTNSRSHGGWGNTIVYFTKDTNLNIIPKICGPNNPNRNIDTCPEFQRQTNGEEYNEMVRLVVEKADAQQLNDEYDDDDIEEMVFDENKNEFLSATSSDPSSYLDMNVVNVLIIVGFIGMIIGGLIIYCHYYRKGNKYEIIE